MSAAATSSAVMQAEDPVTTDIEYVRDLSEAPVEVQSELGLPSDDFPLNRSGWPEEWIEYA